MLNVVIKNASTQSTELLKQKLCKKFPNINTAQGIGVLLDYDEAYLVSREYFAYYFVMTTDEIVNYVNSNGLGSTWRFITDAIFDEGVNAIYRFVDKKSNKHGNILDRINKIFGLSLVDSDTSDYLNRIIRYRCNRAAHFGNGYHKESSDVKYDDIVIILDRLRAGMDKFNEEYFNLKNTIYDNLEIYFCEKIPPIIDLLGKKIDYSKIQKELAQYLNDVISDCKRLVNG